MKTNENVTKRATQQTKISMVPHTAKQMHTQNN